MINLVELCTGGRPSEELEAWSEGESLRLLHGRVTQCHHANKCGDHAVYCMHDDGPRKCGLLWRDGRYTPEDGDPCGLFSENQHWQGGCLPTFKHLLSEGLADIEDDEDLEGASA